MPQLARQETGACQRPYQGLHHHHPHLIITIIIIIIIIIVLFAHHVQKAPCPFPPGHLFSAFFACSCVLQIMKRTHHGARTHDHKVKGLEGPCALPTELGRRLCMEMLTPSCLGPVETNAPLGVPKWQWTIPLACLTRPQPPTKQPPNQSNSLPTIQSFDWWVNWSMSLVLSRRACQRARQSCLLRGSSRQNGNTWG